MKTREELIDCAVYHWSDNELDLLMRILEAPTEEQTKCEYCHKEKAIKLSENCYLKIASSSDANLIEKRSFDYEGWQIGTTKFIFCPNCGRKLGE